MIECVKDETFYLHVGVRDLDGNFVSGLSVSYEIKRLSDYTLLLSGNMTEVDSHYYASGSLDTIDNYMIYYTMPNRYENGTERLNIIESPLGQYDGGGSFTRGKGGKKTSGEIIVSDTGKKSPWTFKQKEEVRKTVKEILNIVKDTNKKVKDKEIHKSLDDILDIINITKDKIDDNSKMDNKDDLISMKKSINHAINLAKEKDGKKLDDVIKKLNDIYWLYLKSMSNDNLGGALNDIKK